jgi:GGDEF domain-containing protein
MGAEAAAIAAMIANAVKASGTVVRIEPEEFLKILKKVDAPLVIYAEGGMISTNYQYMISYKGFAFYCKADDPIELPKKAEVVVADKIWIPG